MDCTSKYFLELECGLHSKLSECSNALPGARPKSGTKLENRKRVFRRVVVSSITMPKITLRLFGSSGTSLLPSFLPPLPFAAFAKSDIAASRLDHHHGRRKFMGSPKAEPTLTTKHPTEGTGEEGRSSTCSFFGSGSSSLSLSSQIV